jgi:hypothetical protein
VSDSTWARKPNETVTEYRMRYLVRHEMRVAKISQVEMARRVGCSRAHVSEMLSGRALFTLKWAELMLRQLGKRVQLEVVDADLDLG